ncbi:MAG: hypothetical protein AAF965_00090 [Pseudomonadota bacterium]
MLKKLTIPILTLLCLIVLDVMVAVVLSQAEARGKLGALVTFFDYGRSVPGKLEKWEANPGARGNLYETAWVPDILARSDAAFQEENPADGPVVRSYGMSFVNNIMRQAVDQEAALIWDGHSGPGGPPNFVFTLFEADRANRRPGDVVVLGLLASGVPAMAALSNRTWVFEQPAPFTYPIYWPEGETGLRAVEPLVTTAEAQRAIVPGSAEAAAWEAQLAEEDRFYGVQTFGLTALDASPFLRLVRRSVAKSYVEDAKADVLEDGAYPYGDVLRRMVLNFAAMAREDGQRPVVMLIQTRDPADPGVFELVQPVLDAENIPYLATVEHISPSDHTAFVGDGHYTKAVDGLFAERLLEGALAGYRGQ